MRVSTKGRYGLRTLVDIALHQKGGTVTLGEIAKRQGISVKYLWQVINPLKTAGLLSVTRGAKGGYSLAKRPEDINMLDVVRTLEGPFCLVDCLDDNDNCDRLDCCVTRSIWGAVSTAIEDTLKDISLAEVLRRYADISDVSNFVI